MRRQDGESRVLLVRAKRNPAEWIFPKGHIEPGESPGDAALRELSEEGGVHGRIRDAVDRVRFELDGRTYQVDYFLVDADGGVASPEGRETRWATLSEALGLLTFADARRLLDRVARLL